MGQEEEYNRYKKKNYEGVEIAHCLAATPR